jgi:large subunit ribosomal protein L9
MQIVLTQDVAHVGQKGDVVQVSNGYGINFLIPHGLAYKSDSPQGQQLIAKVESSASNKAKDAADRVTALKELTGQQFNLPVEANDSGVLFASLNEEKLSRMISLITGKELQPAELALSEGSIKQTGEYEVSLQHNDEVVGSAMLNVTANQI